MKNRKITTVFVLLCMLLMALPTFAQDGEYEITLLHTNDVHARVDEFDSRGNSCDEDEKAEGECFGGAARRATMINQIRGEVDNVILLDGGDQFQGTLFYNLYKGSAAAETMNALGYDAMAVGNHEFDDGPKVLADFIEAADFPVLSANIDASGDASLADKINGHAILDINGEQIGVVGFTTEDTQILSSPGDDVVFNAIEESVQASIDELTAMGINKIFGVSHSGFGRDREVAMAVSGLDAIVSGHTNTFLSNTDEDADGPYPVVLDGADGNPVLLVSDGAFGKHLGRLDITFDADGVVSGFTGDAILLDASVEQDATIQARVEELKVPLTELIAQVIGDASVDLDGDRANCRFAECTMGNLISDAIIANTGAQIAFQNGGGIRASIGAGEVTMGDVMTVLPFGNAISTFDLTGAEVIAALENSVSRADNPENEGTGRFSQVAGVRYSWDPSQPEGFRIVSVDVQGADGSYSPIDESAVYKAAANDFIRNGGDNYTMFETAANAYDFGEQLDVALADYIAANGPVSPELEGRISIAEKEGSSYIVQKGDSLSTISLKFYGTQTRWQEIWQSNKWQIENPRWIQPGMVLSIP